MNLNKLTKEAINSDMGALVDIPSDADDILRNAATNLNKMKLTRNFEHAPSQTQNDIAKYKANALFLWIKYWCVKCIDRKTSVPSFIRDESIFDIF